MCAVKGTLKPFLHNWDWDGANCKAPCDMPLKQASAYLPLAEPVGELYAPSGLSQGAWRVRADGMISFRPLGPCVQRAPWCPLVRCGDFLVSKETRRCMSILKHTRPLGRWGSRVHASLMRCTLARIQQGGMAWNGVEGMLPEDLGQGYFGVGLCVLHA